MKIFVKTLKGTNFEIEVKSADTVSDVKKAIESDHGSLYPAAQQMLIHQGKVLKDETTLEENNVVENSFIVIMLSKAKVSSTAAAPAPAPAPSATQAQPAQTIATPQVSAPTVSVPEPTSGTAFNNPERAVEYLYSGIPGEAEIPPVDPQTLSQQEAPMPATGGPNTNPLNLFPQVQAASSILDFLRNSQQFQISRALGQSSPSILQSMIQELGNQNPQLLPLIRENQAEFLRLINETNDGQENVTQAVPQTRNVTATTQTVPQMTSEEREAIERVSWMHMFESR